MLLLATSGPLEIYIMWLTIVVVHLEYGDTCHYNILAMNDRVVFLALTVT